MAYSADQYLKLLLALLPRGRAWSRGAGKLPEILDGFAQELARVDARVDDLIDERYVLTSSELIGEHETDLGLPDSCTGEVTGLAERQRLAYARLIALGGLWPQYFIDIAAGLGYAITIDEFKPFWAGIGTVGEPCGDQQNLFIWRVNWTYDSSEPDIEGGFSTGFSPGFELDFADPGYQSLRCLFERLKPAHTSILYRAVGPGFSSGFSRGFDSLPSSSLEGGFSKGFSNGFDAAHGGGFDVDGFSSGFDVIK